MRFALILCCLILSFGMISGQSNTRSEKMEVDGTPVLAIISPTDTVYIAELEMYTITSLKEFESDAEYKRYLKYRAFALKVYPYARQAIKIFREMEAETEDLSKRKRKKYIKQLQKELEKEFEEPLKNLSRTQGQILVKMIEKELSTPMYTLLREHKGFGSAFFYNTMSSFYGYKLKHGYIRGEDRVLDAVLDDFDISYRVDRNKYNAKKSGK